MKVKRHDGSHERLVLIGMIVSPTVIAKVASMYGSKTDMFPSRISNIVAKWAVDYWRAYNKPLGKDIRPKFDKWASKHKDRSDVEMVASLLESLSEEYRWKPSKINHSFVVDAALEIFRETSLRNVYDDGLQWLEQGRIDKAEESLSKFIKPTTEEDNDLSLTKEDFKAALNIKSKRLITFPGDLGLFYGDTFERDGFVSFIAPEKSQKSYMLYDVIHNALLNRRKVALFDVGDLTKDQMIQRLAARVAQHPVYSQDGFWPTNVLVPQGELIIGEPMGKEGIRQISYTKSKKLRFTKPLSQRDGWIAWKRWLRREIKAKEETVLSVRSYPNCSVNVQMIRSKLKSWEALKGFYPDVVVLDYADNLAPPFGVFKEETRHQINRTWQELRALSQERHCLVVTATQANAISYGKWLLDRRNFTEDKRKMAHVTAMIVINISAEEKEKGTCRLNYIIRRQGAFSSRRFVAVAGCLDLANPCILSNYPWKRSKN